MVEIFAVEEIRADSPKMMQSYYHAILKGGSDMDIDQERTSFE